MTKTYYVYKITNKINNKKYIGYRGTYIKPEDDLGIKYFSSSKDKDFIKDQKINKDNYLYEVLKEYTNSQDAIKEECRLHELYDVARNIEFYNKAKQNTNGFNICGKVSVKNKNGNIFQVDINDERYVNGKLLSITHNDIWWKKDELNKIWKDNKMPNYEKFKIILIQNGYPYTSYDTMVKFFISNLNDDEKKLRKHYIHINRCNGRKNVKISLETIKKSMITRRKSDNWKYYDELYTMWLIHGNPSYRRFRTIVKNNGYPDVCYNGMTDAFNREYNKEYN